MLVVSTLSRSPEALREAVGGEIDELRVVVPMVRGHDCNGSRTLTIRPENKLKEPPPSSVADSRRRKPSQPAGDSDPSVAVQDALREFAADEVVVVTRPDEEASWLEEGKGGQS